MIPLRDANPTRRFPVVTVGLIVINVLAFFYELLLEGQGQLNEFIFMWGVIPGELTTDFGDEAATLVSSMFLHGGWAHLLGNMLYLWIFGDNVEDLLGPVRYIIFYFVAGFLATAAQVAIAPGSGVPNIGASGAIAGVMGGYILEFPRARITTGIFLIYFLRVAQIPAVFVLGFWFVLQTFNGVAGLTTMSAEAGGVAFFAHIGGFIAGLLLMRPFQLGRPTADRQPYGDYRS